MIVVNFKTYSEATSEEARKLGEICRKVRHETGEEIIVTPATEDLLRLDHVDIPVFSQHVDPADPGSHTGHTLVENVKQAGVEGTLLNHSERRIPEEDIKQAVKKAKEHGLKTIVCAQSPEECEKLSKHKPDYIAYEPPELIGGDTSVSDSQPELIQKAVRASRNVPTLTGAGIKNTEDVRKSVELGCEGVLVASGVVKAENPYKELIELSEGL